MNSSVIALNTQAFFRWWVTELGAMLPVWMHELLWMGRQRLLLRLRDGQIVVTRSTPRGDEEFARFVPGDKGRRAGAGDEVALTIPPEVTLSKVVTLPLAAQENLAGVLAFEMDRQTPFKAEQVYFDYLVTARDAAAQSLTLQLTVVPRDYLDPLLAQLETSGYRPGTVDVGGDTSPGINLLPAARRVRASRLLIGINLLLGLALLGLAGAAVAIPLWQKQQALETLQPLLEDAEQQAKAARTLREDLDKLQQASQFLNTRRRDSVMVLEVLNELTHLLPDDTWSTRVEIRDQEVQVHGETSGADVLIPILDSSPLFHDIRFRSPVTQDTYRNVERFHVSAAIARE